MSSGAQADVYYQTATMINGDLYNNATSIAGGNPALWSSGVAPTAGHTYVNNTPGYLTRFGGTFAGDSLTISGGAGAMLKSTAQSVTLILDNWTGSFGNAQSQAALSGTITGTGSIGFQVAAGSDNRREILNSQLLAGNSFTNIKVRGSTSLLDYLKVTNGSNNFTGTWDVANAILWGSNAGSLGEPAGFNIGSGGKLNFDYDFSNELTTITIEAGGQILLDQDIAFKSVTLFWEELAAGVYAGAELKTNAIYGAAFDSASSDSATLTVVTGPLTGDTITQTAGHNPGESWDTVAKWSDGLAPVASNDYINSTGGYTRTPGTGNEFAGHTLTLTNSSWLQLKHTGTADARITMYAGGGVLNGGSSGTIGGKFDVKGSGSVNFSNGGFDSRTITLNSRLTADSTISTISVTGSGWVTAPAAKSGLILNDAANTFSGTWNVVNGRLKGRGFGTGSFNVGALGYLDFDAAYSNATASLAIDTGGKILLDQDLYFMSVDMYGVELLAGTVLTGAQLKAHTTYGAAFDAASSDTATITVAPPKCSMFGIY